MDEQLESAGMSPNIPVVLFFLASLRRQRVTKNLTLIPVYDSMLVLRKQEIIRRKWFVELAPWVKAQDS